MSNQDPNELARDLKSDDRTAFRKLFESFTRPLVAVAFRYTLDWEAARDLTQETWIKVYENIERYDPSRPFKGWLYSIHRNCCISYLRSPAFRYESTARKASIEPTQIPSRASDPCKPVEASEFSVMLRKAMLKLTDSQRAVFTMVDIEQNSRKDAAEMLGMNGSTLRVTLRNARLKLAGMIRKWEESL